MAARRGAKVIWIGIWFIGVLYMIKQGTSGAHKVSNHSGAWYGVKTHTMEDVVFRRNEETYLLPDLVNVSIIINKLRGHIQPNLCPLFVFQPAVKYYTSFTPIFHYPMQSANPTRPAPDQSIVRIMEEFKESIVIIGEQRKKFGQYSPMERFLFVAQRKLILSDWNKVWETKKQQIKNELEANNIDDQIAANKMGALELEFKEAMNNNQITYDIETYAAIQAILAPEVATAIEISENDVNEAKGFMVRFTGTPITSIEKAGDKARIANILQKKYGSVDPYNMILNKANAELYVSFTSNEGKTACLNGGPIISLGTPTIPPNRAFAENVVAAFCVYIDMLMEGTTVSHIERVFEDMGCKPGMYLNMITVLRHESNRSSKNTESVKVYGDQAFINYETEADMILALKLRRIKVNGRTCNLVAGRFSDPDECKGILGFWTGRTPHLIALYKALDKHIWNYIYVQPTFWAKYPTQNSHTTRTTQEIESPKLNFKRFHFKNIERPGNELSLILNVAALLRITTSSSSRPIALW